MVKESSSHGLQSGGKSTGTFTERFAEKCDSWLKNQTTETQLEETRVKTNSEDPGNKIFGFDNEIKSLKHFLLNQKVNKEFKSLVIVGEYGVGKTALCKTIFNHDDVKSVYAPRIWVSMDREEDDNNTTTERLDGKIYVLKKILTALGVKDLLAMIKTEAEEEYSNRQEAGLVDGETAKEKELSALLYALHLNLRWKKYLIVFDDVRKYLKGDDHWDEKLDVKLKEGEKWGKYLSDGFPKGSGGRVIYTTRDEKLAKELVPEEHEIHRLWPLSDSTSVWNIYDAVLKDKKKESPRNDKKCIDELMNKSRGLPLAARLLAELKPVFVDDIEKADQNDSTTGESTGTADNTTS